MVPASGCTAVMVTSGLFIVCVLPAAEPVTVTPAVTFAAVTLPVNVLLLVAPKATSAINIYLAVLLSPVCPDMVKLRVVDQGSAIEPTGPRPMLGTGDDVG